MARHGRHFGWRPDQPYPHDYYYGAPPAKLRALPASTDLRGQMPPVYDQGRIGSCTANAIGAAIQFDRKKATEAPDFVPSRLFIYYNERSIENDVPYDKGAQIRDGIKSIVKQGVCPESEWPYDDTPADPNTQLWPAGAKPTQQPPAKCFSNAKAYEAVTYLRITSTLDQLRGCLAEGYPFVFGIKVYESFFDPQGQAQTTIPMPSAVDLTQQPEGHAILAVGYDDARNVFVCRNSWGPGVQDKGYFYMPYAYVTSPSLSSDFWTIRRILS